MSRPWTLDRAPQQMIDRFIYSFIAITIIGLVMLQKLLVASLPWTIWHMHWSRGGHGVQTPPKFGCSGLLWLGALQKFHWNKLDSHQEQLCTPIKCFKSPGCLHCCPHPPSGREGNIPSPRTLCLSALRASLFGHSGLGISVDPHNVIDGLAPMAFGRACRDCASSVNDSLIASELRWFVCCTGISPVTPRRSRHCQTRPTSVCIWRPTRRDAIERLVCARHVWLCLDTVSLNIDVSDFVWTQWVSVLTCLTLSGHSESQYFTEA